MQDSVMKKGKSLTETLSPKMLTINVAIVVAEQPYKI